MGSTAIRADRIRQFFQRIAMPRSTDQTGLIALFCKSAGNRAAGVITGSNDKTNGLG